MKESGEDRLKYVVYESTRAPLRGPPSPNYHALRRHCERKPLVHRFNRFYRFNGFNGFKRCSAAHQN